MLDRSKRKPPLHLYGAMIKAACPPKRWRKCQELGVDLVDRGLEPSEIVLGGMMDALVGDGCASEAVEHALKPRSQPTGAPSPSPTGQSCLVATPSASRGHRCSPRWGSKSSPTAASLAARRLLRARRQYGHLRLPNGAGASS